MLYTPEELNGLWEFKVVQSPRGTFRDPRHLRLLLDQEAIAGWQMVEMVDDAHIRFKRPIHWRVQDSYLPATVDPYRTVYSLPVERQIEQMVFLSVVVAVVILLMIIVTVLATLPG